ncbi:hypothetical protein L804_05499 [Cryptococcus deuterogattii 2001/935-1]|nr:hypothetical protein I352_01797 [Cryptococcus deuterogattii MMRL2647]KIR97317.1 hypothetical protein L804_05499 [Cryptococcus deuterogattii 2001/935-1]
MGSTTSSSDRRARQKWSKGAKECNLDQLDFVVAYSVGNA